MTGENNIVDQLTAIDRTMLEARDEYVGYFRHLLKAFNLLIESYNERTKDDPMEIKIIQSFIQRFLNTIEAFRMKYLFDSENRMRIDPTDSCFPNHLEFRELEADLAAKDERLRMLPRRDDIKQTIVDYLFSKKERPLNLLKQLGKREYYLMLQWKKVFTAFTPGEMVQLSDKKGVRRYIYSWGSYDTLTNRPHVYILIFDQTGEGMDLSIDKSRLANFEGVIKKNTNNTAPLKVIASDLDVHFKDIAPKVLKRIDLGPLYGTYATDKHLYTNILKSHFTTDDFALRFTTEIIFSIGEKRTKAFLSKGELRQVFFVDQSNKAAMERHVSEVHKYLLASHGLVQYLRSHHNEELTGLAMPPITYHPNSSGIYGT